MRHPLHPLAALLATALILASCTPIKPRQTVEATPPLAGPAAILAEEEGLYRQARERFDAGELGRAEELYRWLSLTASDPALRRASLYSLALTRLAQAKDENAFRQALDTWKEWSAGRPPSESVREDPAMIGQLLPHLRQALTPPEPPKQDLKKRKSGGSAGQDGEARRELDRVQDENRQLRDKIQALEELQDELKVKQKGIVAP